MFFRANPGMTSLPCSCKEIYSQNATEELLHEDECYDLYGRSRYSNILYEKKKQPASKVTEEDVEGSTIFSQLKLNSSFKSKIHEFREISPWRACGTLRDPHKACTLNSENFCTSENQRTSERDQIQRRSMSTSEAMATQKKNTKSENSYEATRPYSDSKLDENSRKTNYAPRLSSSRYSFGKGAFDKGYKFYHFTDFWKYMKEYMNNVTIVRLHQQYQSEIFRRHGNHIAKYERRLGNLESASTLRPCAQENSQVIDAPATKHDQDAAKKSNAGSASRDKSCDESCYSFKFPSFETCSFKVARCHVHGTESLRKEANKARKKKEQESSVINQKIHMLCQRLSNANCNTKDDGKVRRPKSTKILQRSKTRKLEIVSRPFEKSLRKKPSVTRSKTHPSHWQDYSNLAKRFPSPRIICKSPLIGKQANFQGNVVAKKYPSKIPTKKVFLQYGSRAVHGNI